MRLWVLLNYRNPLWRHTGLALVVGTVFLTLFYFQMGPKPVMPRPGMDLFSGPGAYGKLGTITELLGQGRFILNYQTSFGSDKDRILFDVNARLEEPETIWLMKSPKAYNNNGAWILDGPLEVDAKSPSQELLLGHGNIAAKEPALQWEHGVWTGLSTLVWDDVQGESRGRWTLPQGWHRGLDGKFHIDQGPLRWVAADPKGALRKMDAQQGWMNFSFTDGHLEGIVAKLQDGSIRAHTAEIDPTLIHWTGPIHFLREDGWQGNAAAGELPRPVSGQALELVELAEFKALRQNNEGPETLTARGVRWTPAGLRLEGDVRWDQPQDGQRLGLRAPRVLMRKMAGGTDLPPTLPVGETWAEGQAVITWGLRSLSSPRMQFKQSDRRWRMQSPVLGRAEEGTFVAESAYGSPARWVFEGPIQAHFLDGSAIRGTHLVWEAQVWTFKGQAATWTRFGERLSGPRVIRVDKELRFPDGLTGALVGQDGDVLLRADQGTRKQGKATLDGHVECYGQGWRLQAEHISVTLGQGKVTQMSAKGTVTLRGRLGEGQGDSLGLDLATKTAQWQGKVHGLAEIQP